MELFAEMKKLGTSDDDCAPDFYTFSILIDLYSKVGKHEAAAEFLEKMIQENLSINPVYFHSIMNAARLKNDVESALKYYDLMLKYGVEPNVDTFNILISIYGFRGDLIKVDELLLEMERKGIVYDRFTIGTLIRIYGDNGEFEKAHEWYKMLKTRGMYPTSQIITSMMRISMQQKEPLESTLFYYNLGKNLGILNILHYKDFALAHLLTKTNYSNVIELFLQELSTHKITQKCIYLFVDAVLRPGSLETVHLNTRTEILVRDALVKVQGKESFEKLLAKSRDDGLVFGQQLKREIDQVKSRLIF